MHTKLYALLSEAHIKKLFIIGGRGIVSDFFVHTFWIKDYLMIIFSYEEGVH